MTPSRGLAPDLVVLSQVPPPVHGQTLMTKRTLDLLARDGWTLRLVDRRFSRSIDEVGTPSVRKLLAAVGLAARLAGQVIRRRPDAVLLFATTRTASFCVDVVLVRLLRAVRVPVVLTIHSVGFRRIAARSAVGAAAVRSLLGTAEAVVCLGPTLTADVRPFVRADRVRVIRNTPAEVPPVIAAERQAHGRRTVLWLSNLMPGKGAETFAHVAADLADHDVDFRMVGPVADDATADAVRSIVVGSAVRSRLHLDGPAYGAAKWEAVRGATVLAFTSELDEAQPLTIVEAMACGTPVVAFDRGGIADLVEHGVTGFLAEPGDTAAFAAHVRQILDDPGLAARLRRGALDAYAARHAPDTHVQAWRDLFDHPRTTSTTPRRTR